MGRYCHLSVAIPMMAESENVARLMRLFQEQSIKDFSVYCCVNNVEGCEEDVYSDNQRCIELLREAWGIELHVIDCSTRGKGWKGKRKGVGWARKVLFENILEKHDDNEIIVSLDADTGFERCYLERVLEKMNQNPESNALGVPYYHPLCGVEQIDRAMLRYECYMRHYLINLLRIGSPYAFSALGSAMVFPAWAYRRVGGITPLQGGEDFYLMQKFAKTGRIEQKFDLWVEPQGRISNRVPFGTGPAIGKGIRAMDESYPFYSRDGFEAIAETYDMFPALYKKDVATPMSEFLIRQLGTEDIWGPLRRNFKSEGLFVRACHERIDGLRILQFLKASHFVEDSPRDFMNEELEKLQEFRNGLFEMEMRLRR